MTNGSHFAILQDEDPIGSTESTQAVGHDERRAALHCGIESLADFVFGLGVDRGCCVIEQKDRRVQ